MSDEYITETIFKEGGLEFEKHETIVRSGEVETIIYEAYHPYVGCPEDEIDWILKESIIYELEHLKDVVKDYLTINGLPEGYTLSRINHLNK